MLFERVMSSQKTKRFLNPLWKVLKMMGKGDESEKYLKICDKLLYKIIDERLEREARGEEEKEDLLSFFLKIRDENDRPLSRKYLRDTCFNLLLGGKDTQPKSINLL